uniref:Uncharacterized protein n=2 Tax=Picea TaxID=3328 RepID=A0A101LX78_PICGL|nr:hypothetical protein ABT39_MTgene6001 [Picea glauca]QHR91450.1 hypothetical protein Q903MT_gene5484 [Picea sitchensis]
MLSDQSHFALFRWAGRAVGCLSRSPLRQVIKLIGWKAPQKRKPPKGKERPGKKREPGKRKKEEPAPPERENREQPAPQRKSEPAAPLPLKPAREELFLQ